MVIRRMWVRILPCASFFLLLLSFPTFLYHYSVHNQVPLGGASLNVCCEREKKRIPCLAAWAKTGSISSDWVKKFNNYIPLIDNKLRPCRATSSGIRILDLLTNMNHLALVPFILWSFCICSYNLRIFCEVASNLCRRAT